METILSMEEVTKCYQPSSTIPGFRLPPFSLSVAAGGWVALTGRSGVGKSTVLQLITGLDRPDGGRIRIFGRDITDDSEAALSAMRRDRFGIVYQQFHFIDHLPVWQNVTCRFIPIGHSNRIRRDLARRILQELALPDCLDRLPRTLSGGEQQRVALARALINDPAILVADEPTSNVDAHTGTLILDQLRQRQQSGTTIITATHDPALIEAADRECVIGERSVLK